MSDTDTGGSPIDALSIGEIDRELVEIDERLDTLPADDFEARVTLRQRRLDLKARAAHLSAGADEQRTTEDLMTEIRSLNQRIGAIQDAFVESADQDGESSISGSYHGQQGPSAMNREIADAQGARELVARRDKLEAIVRGRDAGADGSAPAGE